MDRRGLNLFYPFSKFYILLHKKETFRYNILIEISEVCRKVTRMEMTPHELNMALNVDKTIRLYGDTQLQTIKDGKIWDFTNKDGKIVLTEVIEPEYNI